MSMVCATALSRSIFALAFVARVECLKGCETNEMCTLNSRSPFLNDCHVDCFRPMCDVEGPQSGHCRMLCIGCSVKDHSECYSFFCCRCFQHCVLPPIVQPIPPSPSQAPDLEANLDRLTTAVVDNAARPVLPSEMAIGLPREIHASLSLEKALPGGAPAFGTFPSPPAATCEREERPE